LPRFGRRGANCSPQPAGYRDDRLARSHNRPDNDAGDFYRELARWEYAWCEAHESYPTAPQGDSVVAARALFAKWSPVMSEGYARFDWRKLEPKP
jgi:hypothetical protein